MTGGSAEVKANTGSNDVHNCGFKVQGEGEQSIFHDNMAERTFDGKQPNWNPSTF